MATGLQKETVPNLVQGVSQQAEQVRRSTQAESQFDCLNQAVEGCANRPGLDVIAKVNTDDNRDAFFYDIIRSSKERYTAIIRKDGTLRVYNYLTGALCAVTVGDTKATAYLANLPAGVKPYANFEATAADDVTFIANKSVSPAMDPASVSPSRPHEALFNFRGGAYSNAYQIGIKFAGVWYNWSYTTPDNSVAGNAASITPSAICYSLYTAMTTGTNNMSSLGFNIARNGSILRVWRSDSDFDIVTDDSQNNQFMVGLKDTISGFDQLPKAGYDGMVFKVLGDKSSEADDYYVHFNSHASAHDSSTQGVWEECIAPGTKQSLNAGTMPVVLINTAVNTFTLGLGNYGTRIAGDGIDSAKDPSFVGDYIEDIFFDQRRLAIMTEAACVWSQTDNPYLFFPDTVQADLATAPIDAKVKASKRIALLRHPLQADAETYLWAEGAQFQVSHIETSVFSDQTIEIDPVTTYDWKESLAPVQVGSSVIFATELGGYTTFTDAAYQQGKSLGETGITDHVPTYVPGDVRCLSGSNTLKKLVIYSEDTPSQLYLYEYRISGDDRQQSAWNTWRLPTNSHVVHCFLDKDMLYAWVQRPDGLHLMTCSLRPYQQDADGAYLTRLDMRVTEAACTASYDLASNKTTILLPYDYSDTQDHVLGADTSNPVLCIVARQSDATFLRGTILTAGATFSQVGGKTQVVVNGDCSSAKFYAGFRIRSERTEPTFYAHDDQSAYVHYDRLQVMAVILSYAKTGYVRAELINRAGVTRYSTPFEGKTFGDPASIYDAVTLAAGNFEVPVGQLNNEVSVRWINDTYLPGAWQGLIWKYQPTSRA